MVSFAPQCGASTGQASQLLVSLIQTLLAAHCSISPPDMWPEDYGKVALEKGKNFLLWLVRTRNCIADKRQILL